MFKINIHVMISTLKPFQISERLVVFFFPTICIIVVYFSGVKKSAAPRSGTGGLWVRT